MVEIVDGIDDADQVITVGHVGLKDDATVTIINADPGIIEAAAPGEPEESGDATVD